MNDLIHNLSDSYVICFEVLIQLFLTFSVEIRIKNILSLRFPTIIILRDVVSILRDEQVKTAHENHLNLRDENILNWALFSIIS